MSTMRLLFMVRRLMPNCARRASSSVKRCYMKAGGYFTLIDYKLVCHKTVCNLLLKRPSINNAYLKYKTQVLLIWNQPIYTSGSARMNKKEKAILCPNKKTGL